MFGKTIIALSNLVRSGKVNLSPVLDSPRFQSTHPRGVRQSRVRHLLWDSKVSIHAPTRGATAESRYNFIHDNGFNPRTHEGCDSRSKVASPSHRCFNPRTHEGCDAAFVLYYARGLQVSIHAPTRGATCFTFQTVIDYEVSIHAPTRGATR